jgi:uncharacterized membrane protein
MEKKRRYELLDAYRGFTILSMIGYHFSYDVFILYGRYPEWLSNPFGYIWQQSICISFILICGLCASFSRDLLKRGILINICGLVITGVTAIASPSAVVYFGVLNLLGCSLLLLIPVRKMIHDKNWWFIGLISFLLFFLFRNVADGYLGFGNTILYRMPVGLYHTKWMVPVGFPYPGFYSSDYFPILPWFFLFLTGYCMSFYLKKAEWLKKILEQKVPVLSWIGKHSLIIYMLHQPVLMGICILFFR